MNKWVKSLTAMALASSLFMVGCGNGDDNKKEDEPTQQDEETKDEETSTDSNSSDSKEKK
ncbi:hypothetical protein QUF88_12340 [Bacillus sp. DX1.1]|uniref:hypothetical protein n=1 Tax=unclassified Bacillus (in: firmicutes) TaxID=185979 RepID=UPI0025700511|nr:MULTISPECIES: hypothetical protein [unclassified Bacillus (in: firmicutes)]MDM5154596.1 hypothetical protein [Bacillus sp. DX1.1]WJE83488.1 hypothetical protein QRE67_09835 [Bacillus sp. DX3.1]